MVKPTISKNSKYNQGIFTPKSPKKYVGKGPILYRSAWELTFMNVCDMHPAITQWSSESVNIPYQNEDTGKWHTYIPDFLIKIEDGTNPARIELVEIKPASQTLVEYARSKRDKQALQINMYKWKAAKRFCEERGIFFRVMTEHDLYKKAPARKSLSKHPPKKK